MGRASREKWERKIMGAVQDALKNKETPWYESNLLWVPLTTAIAIICVWVPAMKADLHWLIWLAWFMALYPFWIVVNNICKRPLYKRVFYSVILLLSAIGTDYFYKALQPIAVSPREAKLVDLFGPPIEDMILKTAVNVSGRRSF